MSAEQTTLASSSVPTQPREEYQRRLESYESSLRAAELKESQLSAMRGLIFLSAIVLLLAAINMPEVSAWWLLLPGGVFLLLVIAHARVSDRLVEVRRAVDLYKVALDRLDDKWIGIGPTGERYLSDDHSYAADLDIFGQGSLFQLLCRARTRLGENRLADWLSKPADVATIGERQNAVAELRDFIDLREKLALLNAEVHDDLDQNGLRTWAALPPRLLHPAAIYGAHLLGVLMVSAFVGWIFFGTGLAPILVVALAEMFVAFFMGRRIKGMTAEADKVDYGLEILSQVLSLLEQEQFAGSHLQRLRTHLDTDGMRPSRRIAQLDALSRWLDNAVGNQFFAAFAFLLCLHVPLVQAIEKWRLRYGQSIPNWLDAVGELEALLSLAEYAYERPENITPELVAMEDKSASHARSFFTTQPFFTAQQLGHPLLPENECVRNDVTLESPLQLLLISGSNMSGKSTLLRTIGVNSVLALAGGAVRAKSLRLTPVRIGTAMRINDSLQDGRSLFYAVIGRLKQVIELTDEQLPLLFLFDEILQGTNSHDRRVGAEGVIRNLIDRGAIGLVTTHDLALTEIVGTLDGKAANMHFEDQLVDGKMRFDYQLREGVVQRSNALELMRMMGLDV